jgi:hypothetical protein
VVFVPFARDRGPAVWATNKALSTAVTRGLDPRVHLLRIDFANVMDARVKPAHDNQVDHLDGEPL